MYVVVIAEPPTTVVPHVRTTAIPSHEDDLIDQIVHPEQKPELPTPGKLDVPFVSVISSILSLLSPLTYLPSLPSLQLSKGVHSVEMFMHLIA